MQDKNNPPKFDKDSRQFYDISKESEVQLVCNTLNLDPENDKLCLEQVFWLANMHSSVIGKYTPEIYRWLEKNNARAFVPFDNWREMMRD